MKYLKKGFTLIELIIVMAVLGILAAGLIAALNPVEQLNRGKDTSNKAQAREIVDAINRYYASSNQTPWSATNGCTLPDTVLPGIITQLKSSNELKSSFNADMNNICIKVNDATTPDAQVCVRLQSKGGQQSGNYHDGGVTPCQPGTTGPGQAPGPGPVPGPGGSGLCEYYCISAQ